MMDLWTLLVENIFGGFWLSVFGMTLIMFIILAIGSLSGAAILEYLMLFLFAMALGYGYPLITVLFFGIIVYYFVSQLIGWQERSGGQ
jgi:hypothetical protein